MILLPYCNLPKCGSAKAELKWTYFIKLGGVDTCLINISLPRHIVWMSLLKQVGLKLVRHCLPLPQSADTNNISKYSSFEIKIPI
jgi:hypothetical protein